MDDILEQLNRLRGVGGCIVLNSDGLPMASQIRDGIDEDGLCANLASVIERIRRLCEGVNVGKPTIVQLESKDGALVLMSTGDNYLAVLVDPNANLALLELETKPFVEKIRQKCTL